MDTVFFLSGLEDDIYGKVLDVMEKYGRLELKCQRATKKLTGRFGTNIDCPRYPTSFPGPFPWPRPQAREKALRTRLLVIISGPCEGT